LHVREPQANAVKMRCCTPSWGTAFHRRILFNKGRLAKIDFSALKIVVMDFRDTIADPHVFVTKEHAGTCEMRHWS